MSQNLSIAYLNQYFLEHPKLLPVLNDISTKLPRLVYGRNEFVEAVTSSWYNRIGKDTMQYWLDSLHYGTSKITTRIDTFWLDNSLKITADEQLGFVKKLYFNQLPFRKNTTQEVVKKIMLQEKNTNYSLSYKTGLGYRENGNALGWIVGWIEENRHPYFFVLNVEGNANTNMKNIRLSILKNILKANGFFEGKK